MVSKEEIPKEIREQVKKEDKRPNQEEIDKQKILQEDGEWALEFM